MAAAAVVVVMELVETGRVAQVEAAQVAMIQELMPYPERQIEAAVAGRLDTPVVVLATFSLVALAAQVS